MVGEKTKRRHVSHPAYHDLGLRLINSCVFTPSSAKIDSILAMFMFS
jgi:hypothetical protein